MRARAMLKNRYLPMWACLSFIKVRKSRELFYVSSRANNKVNKFPRAGGHHDRWPVSRNADASDRLIRALFLQAPRSTRSTIFGTPSRPAAGLMVSVVPPTSGRSDQRHLGH